MRSNEKNLRSALRWDRFARWTISLGGIVIVLTMLAMIVLMARVAWPLFMPPKAQLSGGFQIDDPEQVLTLGVDNYGETGYLLTRDGVLHFHDLISGALLDQVRLREDAQVAWVESHGEHQLSILWADGAVSHEQVLFKPVYNPAGDRTVIHEHHTGYQAEGRSARAVVLRQPDQGVTEVDIQGDSGLLIQRRIVNEGLLGEDTVSQRQDLLDVPAVTAVALSSDGAMLYAGTANGELFSWRLDQGAPQLVDQVKCGRPVEQMALIYGDYTLIIAGKGGYLSSWFHVSGELTEIHVLSSDGAGLTQLLPSRRDKSLVTLDEAGEVRFYHMTSSRLLFALKHHAPLKRVAINPRGSALLGMDESGSLTLWYIDNPHPETTFATLWDKVWYEGYEEPVYAWQSSSASDDYEPKLSLMPLLFGSLKGTFYCMLFAIPIALMSAVYVSYLMNPRWRNLIKPVIELMAAVPTVIIGFLAALWLAPLLANRLPAVFIAILTVPVTVIAGLFLCRKALESRLSGYEFLAALPLVILGIFLAESLGDLALTHWFDNDFGLWYFQNVGRIVDQRNNVIIAFALGFAVIPIIFTIAEDALSNVPQHLTAAAFALGADRWQALQRVVLPIAAPGIIAAAAIGFGRAVGETMIVLMVTGNTPIMDLDIFNGMRTLSANIAVEIPEAPVDGSLYRVLFLSALLLFILTFFVNTVAELIRHRLRRRYEGL